MARLRLLRLVWIFVKLLLPHKSSTYKFVCIQLTTDVWLMGGSGFACSTADVGLTASRIHTSSLVGDHVNGSVAAAGHCWKSILWQQGSRTVLWVITRDLHALERYHSHTFFFFCESSSYLLCVLVCRWRLFVICKTGRNRAKNSDWWNLKTVEIVIPPCMYVTGGFVQRSCGSDI